MTRAFASRRSCPRDMPGPGASRGAVRQADRLDGELTPEEAELAKLFTNSWRYIKFAAANQFFMIANDLGLDFAQDPGRADPGLPARGRHAGGRVRGGSVSVQGHHAAGGFQRQQRSRSGHAAMLVNEGLPVYLVSGRGEHRPVDG